MTEKTTTTETANNEEVKPFVPFTKKGKNFAIIDVISTEGIILKGREGYLYLKDVSTIKDPEEGLTVNLTKAENGNWIPELEPKTKKTGRGNPVDLTDDQMAAINSYF